MKIGFVNLFPILFVFLLTSCIIFPSVYGEVTSLKTSDSFYKGGDKIYFSGTTAPDDPSYVTIVIFDPNGKFILLTSGITGTDHTFQAMVDTSNQANQQKFSPKGIYNATAFIAQQSAGKTVYFVFSPNGSPIIPSPPTSLKATPFSSVEIDLSWVASAFTGGSSITGYQIERNDGNGFNVIHNSQTITYQDTGLTPGKQYSYRVSAVNVAGTSNPSNMVYGTTLSLPVQSNPQSPSGTPQTVNETKSIYEEIQKRIENAKRLQELLNQKSKVVTLNENIDVGDLVGNVTTNLQTENKTSPFDFNNILYPVIALSGAGLIAAIIYLKKNRLWFKPTVKSTSKPDLSPLPKSIESDSDFLEEDYSLLILKNRLAKGEITIEEFNKLKEALKEP